MTANSVPACPGGRGRHRRRWSGLAAGTVAVTALLVLSVAVGAKPIPVADVVRALTAADGGETAAIVHGLRLPRTGFGVAAGAALGMAGALIQAVTRNPLADPGILGISAGASLGVVAGTGLLGVGSLYGYVWFGFAGALGAMTVVYLLAGVGRGGATPAKLAVAGAAVSAVLFSLVSAIVLTDVGALDRYRFWVVGALTGSDRHTLGQVVPFLLVGAVLATTTAGPLNTLALGEDVARSLGQHVTAVRARTAAAVTLLAGAAVAVCGPIAFVGLVVPHIARALVGPDQRWILAYCTVLGPLFLLAADIIGRIVARPGELPVGIVVAAVGAPFFIVLVRRHRMPEL
jgi:iron complex transport system permease protein